VLETNSVIAQQFAPFKMPAENHKEMVYNNIDFYHFSTVAFDSKNRPYGFNIHEEFGYIRTLRNGLWVKINYLDDLQKKYPGKEISNLHKLTTHTKPRVAITTDDHLYLTLNYLVDGKQNWAILYLDNINNDNFQVQLFPKASNVILEEFTGHNYNNGETPGILINESGASLSSLGWPKRLVTWTISNVTIVKFLTPYRNTDGTISFNTTLIGERLGGTTNHSGGCAAMATKGNKTYLTYSGFDEKKILEKGERKNVNQGYIAEITRPKRVTGKTIVRNKYMGLQSVYGHIDSHSQGSVVFDKDGKLHYMPGNHAACDEYFRTKHCISDAAFSPMTDAEWVQFGTTTPKGDFSYDTPVIDNDNMIYVAYRQRNKGKGRGLYVKSAPTNVTDWGKGLGELIIQPPAPWNESGAYIIFYHRLIMDRANNVHINGTFLEFKHYEKGMYPRIGAVKENGEEKWEMVNRYKYLKHIVGGKEVQQISLKIKGKCKPGKHAKIITSSNKKNAFVKFEVVEGNARLNKNKIIFDGKGDVLLRAFSEGNDTFYADEIYKKIEVN
jgi:hypothetical protein